MTLDDMETPQEVEIRELHDQLGRYVRRVAEGGEVVVTIRDRPVARLIPLDAYGPVALPQEPSRPRTRTPSRIRLKGPGPLMSDYVIEQRG